MFRIRFRTPLKKSPGARSQNQGSSPAPSRPTPARQSPQPQTDGASGRSATPVACVSREDGGGDGGRRSSDEDVEAAADLAAEGAGNWAETGGSRASVRYAGIRAEPKVDFRPFTKASAEKFDDRCAKIARDCGYPRKRKSNIEDESVLPDKYEPFPPRLYGHPLEEIDNFIYEEVSFKHYVLFKRLWCRFSALFFFFFVWLSFNPHRLGIHSLCFLIFSLSRVFYANFVFTHKHG